MGMVTLPSGVKFCTGRSIVMDMVTLAADGNSCSECSIVMEIRRLGKEDARAILDFHDRNLDISISHP